MTKHPPWLETLKRAARLCPLAALAIAAGAAPDYLPAVGPSPLRFTPTEPPRQMAHLPPLLPDEALPTKPYTPLTQAAVKPAPAPPGPPPAAPSPVPSSGPTDTDAVSSAIAAPLGGPVETNLATQITPQMLVQFFKPPGTYHAVNSVVMPVFVPPVVSNPLSSSATYKTP